MSPDIIIIFHDDLYLAVGRQFRIQPVEFSLGIKFVGYVEPEVR